MNPVDLTGTRIFITGGLGAIGTVVVSTLANNGATVIVNDILPDDVARERLAGIAAPAERVHYVAGDVSTPEGIEDVFDRVEEATGFPEVVCAHAGLVEDAALPDITVESFDRVMNLNVRANFLTAQAASRRWLASDRPGNLIFTTGWVEDVPWPGIASYNASKAALRSLMRQFARELAPRGIRANAIAPGIVGVGMAKIQWDTVPEYKARAAKAIPLGEMQPPESVANAFLFLSSALSTSMTGSVLLVDGGCSLYPMD